jgi:hypothetical protein
MPYRVTILMSAHFALVTPGAVGKDKPMKSKFHLALALAAAPFLAMAQAPAGQVPGLSDVMAKFFGDNQAFTATAIATILDADGQASMTMPMNYAVLDGKIRSEVDMTQVKSKALEGSAASLKQMGMDRTLSIVRPDQKKVLLIYPSLRAYAEWPITNAAAGTPNEAYKVDSTLLGKETIDGHPCEKKKVTVSGTGGEKHEAIVWNATDMRNFPVKMEMKQAAVTTVMAYSNVKFDKPDAKLFEPPTGFEKYDSVEKMMQATIMKLLGTPPQR